MRYTDLTLYIIQLYHPRSKHNRSGVKQSGIFRQIDIFLDQGFLLFFFFFRLLPKHPLLVAL